MLGPWCPQPPFEAKLSEIFLCKNELHETLNNLSRWMKDEHMDRMLDPFGVVLIIAPWNYPVHLFLVPLIGAIAAGNCVIVKPSEVSKKTERLVAEALPVYLDKDCFAVVTGGMQETTRLLENKFDYIFFSGSPPVGQIVMTAAAKHLTPVTLELGGKNPCYVSDTCDVTNVARRVAWGRFFNAGQTCIAPDYLLCSVEMQEKLLPDFGRIVNDKQFQPSAVGMWPSGDRRTRPTPTVLADVLPSDPAMQEKIFGPILPIVIITSMDEAIDFIDSLKQPLAVYAFSSDDKVLERTSSGGFCGNDTLMHLMLTSLPFGGIGNSSLGMYQGKFSFDTFSHRCACLKRGMGQEPLNAPCYPPVLQPAEIWACPGHFQSVT
uniref:Aldehyde dehydrogenase domain-containing protein n=1 Tax=Malurus cyaneus samueli TaxID=2593467 RepID=A0A8C5TGX7_9PASS